MTIEYNKTFKKQFSNLQKNKKMLVRAAIAQFRQDLETGNSTPHLRRHSLDGEWLGYDFISAGGDLRAHFEVIGETIVFVAVGTHSQLYG
ncbi:MAG: type II toxin-antitoxin system mRNA interferase toxin, RelE/StbE family [Defluviitaleaceae bacterium]|nr:type II toxin-antitoxin system mRNA interferase toxin, RelE/StbE family [Defluviitaleaceae bacterium]